MKTRILIALVVLIGTALFSACSNQEGQCLIKGEFTNMSEGELYFYMPDGPREKIDTVIVREGKFNYAIPLERNSYTMLLFPNMSEQVVFVEPGLTVEIDANATQLRDIKISGGTDNKLMSEFRTAIRELSEGQIQEKAAELIGQHPVSSFGSFLLKRYLMNVSNPNLALVNNALESMIKAQPQHLNLKNMQEKIQSLISVSKGGKAPEFTVKDNQGIEHKLSDYKGKDFILVFGASWAEDYREQLRAIKSDVESMESPLEVINIVMDQNRPTIRSIMRDSIPGATIPEGRNWFSEIAQDYQILTLPTFFLIDKNQKIVAREEEWSELKKQIK